MGYATALDLATSDIPLDTAIYCHLTSNCFPPMGAFQRTAVETVHAYVDEDFDREVDLPEGVEYHGRTTAPARVVVSNLRLDAFVDEYRYDPEAATHDGP